MSHNRSFQWTVHDLLQRLGGAQGAVVEQAEPCLCPTQKAATWVVTGGTGWLGRHMIRQILRHDPDAFILAPVRAVDRDEAASRLRMSLLSTPLIRQEAEASRWWLRLTPLAVKSLEMENKEGLPNPYQKVDYVVHCAANKSLAAGLDQAWRDNVTGTQRLVEWARHYGAVRFDHVSTLSVLTASTYPRGRLQEKIDLMQCGTLFGAYAATQWACEAWLAQQDKKLAVAVHRPGLLDYSREDGWAASSGMAAAARAWKQWGQPAWMDKLPYARVDWAPVDKVSQGMMQAIQMGMTGPLHWTSQTCIPADALMLLFNTLSPAEPSGEWPLADLLGKTARRALGRLSNPRRARCFWWHDLFQADRHTFDTSRAQQAFPAWNWSVAELRDALSNL